MKANRKIAEWAEGGQITVLLIEDSLEDGVMITQACIQDESFYDFTIIRRYTLEGGLEYMHAAPVDIVLLDLGLPDARGLKAVNAIHSEFPQVPVVVISGYSNAETVTQALRSGVQEFLIKGESSGAVIRQSLYQAMARKKIELSYERGEKL